MKIVFMGTPEFAVPCLKILVEAEYDIVGVITAPDKPKGRGKKVSISAVKEYALTRNLNILQPPNLKSTDFLTELRKLNADLQIVVAFRMLPEVVWNMPPKGTFNLHASLLPNYRGAAPINWAIINGEKETGVTTFFLKHEIDTGNILFQEKEVINAKDDVSTLYNRLMLKGADLVLKTVRAIEANNYEEKPQVPNELDRPAPKIHKETCEIDWNKEPHKIADFVRGLSPYPAAWSIISDKKFKIFKVESLGEAEDNQDVGAIDTDGKSYIHINVKNGKVSILELQPDGKKRMGVADFLRGNKL